MKIPDPGAFAVTRPAPSTEATLESVDSQTMAWSVALAGDTVATTCLVSPRAKSTITWGVTFTPCTATGLDGPGSPGAAGLPQAVALRSRRTTVARRVMVRIVSLPGNGGRGIRSGSRIVGGTGHSDNDWSSRLPAQAFRAGSNRARSVGLTRACRRCAQRPGAGMFAGTAGAAGHDRKSAGRQATRIHRVRPHRCPS